MLGGEDDPIGPPVGLMVYGLCGLARFANRKKGKEILPKLGAVGLVLAAIDIGLRSINRGDESSTVPDNSILSESSVSSDSASIVSTTSSTLSGDSDFDEKAKHLNIMLIAKALHCLMNLSTHPDNQVFIARSGLSTIFKVAMRSTFISN